MRNLEQEDQDGDDYYISEDSSFAVRLAWCHILEVDPPVEIQCAIAMVSQEYYNPEDDDTWRWMGKSRWFDTECTFSTDYTVMNCTSTGSDYHHETLETECSVNALVAGATAAEACSCQKLTRGYTDETCHALYECDEQQEETNECNSCYIERECDQCYYEDPQSPVEYNGIPWTDTFFQDLLQAIQDGENNLELEDCINVTQPSIQKQHMAWNLQGSHCTDVKVTADGQVIKTRVRDASNFNAFGSILFLVLIVCALGFAFKHLWRRYRSRKEPLLMIDSTTEPTESNYVLT